jgi:outer membrane lipoprotein
LLALAGCASKPLVDRTGVDVTMSPQQVSEASGMPVGTVNWGGRIIAVRNAGEATELEILSYPLRGNGRPDTGRASDGRFIAVKTGFVDPLVYDQGRTVTIVGTLREYRDGQIGEQAYRWPVITATQIAPAPEPAPERVTPFFSIGVGVGF